MMNKSTGQQSWAEFHEDQGYGHYGYGQQMTDYIYIYISLLFLI